MRGIWRPGRQALARDELPWARSSAPANSKGRRGYPMKTLTLGWLAAEALCGALLLASCTGGERAVREEPLGWGAPIEAGEVLRWPREILEEAPRWSMGEAPTFVVVPDSVQDPNSAARQRYIHAGTVLSDGRVVLLCAVMSPDSVLLHIFDPASGGETKIRAPNVFDSASGEETGIRGADGQPLRWSPTQMIVGDHDIALVGLGGLGSGGMGVLFANREGDFTRAPAHLHAEGGLLGVFPDGSFVLAQGRDRASDTTLMTRVVSVRPVPVEDEPSEADRDKVILTTAMAADFAGAYSGLQSHGGGS